MPKESPSYDQVLKLLATSHHMLQNLGNLHVALNFAFRKPYDQWAPYQIPPVIPPQAVALLTVRLMNNQAPASPILLMVSFGMTIVSFFRM